MKKMMITALLAAMVGGSHAAKISRNGKGRSQKDLGNILIQFDIQSSGNGSITWGGGNLNGGWWQPRWNVGNNQMFMKCGKHYQAGSIGYPKTLSKVNQQKRARYNSKVHPGFRMRGRWQNGAYTWLDNNRSGLGTEEINVWNRPYSTSRNFTYFGDLWDDGSAYRIYRFRNNGFNSWVLPRQSIKLPMSQRFSKNANFLRRKHGMPNHQVINVLLAQEGHNRGAQGWLDNTNFGVANL